VVSEPMILPDPLSNPFIVVLFDNVVKPDRFNEPIQVEILLKIIALAPYPAFLLMLILLWVIKLPPKIIYKWRYSSTMIKFSNFCIVKTLL
jgi:hypothetical protein